MTQLKDIQRLSDEFRKAFCVAFRLYGLDPDVSGTEQPIYQIHIDGAVIPTAQYEDALFELWRNGYEQGKLMERANSL